MVKRKNDNELLNIYPFLRPVVTFVKQQSEPSIHLKISLEILQPLGCLEEHYREPTANEPLFDVVCYVLSGRVRAKVGDIEKTVGPDTLIYCPSNVKCSIANVGKGQAKYLAICALAEGKKFGEPIYSKMPTWRI
jgi:mannose-6-phosphate isomerase-like protein (cupin superfamily)